MRWRDERGDEWRDGMTDDEWRDEQGDEWRMMNDAMNEEMNDAMNEETNDATE